MSQRKCCGPKRSLARLRRLPIPSGVCRSFALCTIVVTAVERIRILAASRISVMLLFILAILPNFSWLIDLGMNSYKALADELECRFHHHFNGASICMPFDLR